MEATSGSNMKIAKIAKIVKSRNSSPRRDPISGPIEL